MRLLESFSLYFQTLNCASYLKNVAAYVLGARKGRFREIDGRLHAKDFPGHSIALKMLGVFILWFG